MALPYGTKINLWNNLFYKNLLVVFSYGFFSKFMHYSEFTGVDYYNYLFKPGYTKLTDIVLESSYRIHIFENITI